MNNQPMYIAAVTARNINTFDSEVDEASRKLREIRDQAREIKRYQAVKEANIEIETGNLFALVLGALMVESPNIIQAVNEILAPKDPLASKIPYVFTDSITTDTDRECTVIKWTIGGNIIDCNNEIKRLVDGRATIVVTDSGKVEITESIIIPHDNDIRNVCRKATEDITESLNRVIITQFNLADDMVEMEIRAQNTKAEEPVEIVEEEETYDEQPNEK